MEDDEIRTLALKQYRTQCASVDKDAEVWRSLDGKRAIVAMMINVELPEGEEK